MPKITINGRAQSAKSAGNRATGGATAGGNASGIVDAIASALSTGDTSGLAQMGPNLPFSPSFQSGAWQAGAARQLMQQVVQEIRAIRRAGGVTPGYSAILQTAGTLGNMGLMSPEMQGMLGVLRNVGGKAGYPVAAFRAAGLPSNYLSASRGFSMSGSPYGANADTVLLKQIADSTRFTAQYERERAQAEKKEGGALSRAYSYAEYIGRNWQRSGAYGARARASGPTINAAWWGGATSGGGGMYGPPLPPSAPIPAPNLTSAGGFGGRGGGGGGGGTGGAAAGSGGSGFRRIMGAAGLGMPLGVAGAVRAGPAALLGAVAMAPQLYGTINNVLMGLSEDYRGYMKDTYGLARAGGYFGNDLMREFFPGAGETPSWMKNTGLTPQEAMALVKDYGFVPQSNNQAALIASMFGGQRLTAGWSGMDTSEMIRSARQFATYSGNTGTRLDDAHVGQDPFSYVRDMGRILEMAVQQGLDRSRVLHSMEGALAMSVRGGALGVNPDNMQSFMWRFLTSGLPGGRSGELGMQTLGNVQGAISGAMENPTRAMMMVQGVTNARDRGSLATLLGAGDASSGRRILESIEQSDAGKTAVANYLKLANTQPALAVPYLQSFMQQAPDAWMYMSQNYTNKVGLPPGFGPVAAGNLSGAGLTGQLGYNSGENALRGGYMVPGSSQHIGIGEYRVRPNDEEPYRRALSRMGVPDELIDKVMTHARAQNVDPLQLGAVMMTESKGIPGATAPDSTAKGLMQTIDATTERFGGGNPYDPDVSLSRGAAYLRFLGRSGKPIAAYNRGENGNLESGEAYSYENRVRQRLNQAGIPTDVFSAESSSAQINMMSSAASFAEFGRNLATVNDVVGQFGKQLNIAVDKLKNFNTSVLPNPQIRSPEFMQ